MPSEKIIYHSVTQSDNSENTDAEDLPNPPSELVLFYRLHITLLYVALGCSLLLLILRWNTVEIQVQYQDPSLQKIWCEYNLL